VQTRDTLLYEYGSQLSTALAHSAAIERVILAMRERLQEPLSLQDMADVAHMSPYHFSRVFHRLIGIPPGEFLTALRLDAAKRLLLTTSLSVTDICFKVGYLSPGSFTTRFTQLVGLPPRQLRQVAGDYTLPCPESLHDTATYSFCHVPFRGCFFGRVSVPIDFTGVIYVGVFPKPIPQGRPCSCTLLGAPGSYFIKSLTDGSYYVLAVALPFSGNAHSYLLPDTNVLAGMTQGPLVIHNGKMTGQPDIRLRPRRVTDPPIVAALPFV
jgi:AraC family transcriptional regulator